MALPLTASAALRYWNMARQRHCRRLARNGKPAASLLTPSSSEPRTPARKAGVVDLRKRIRARDGLSAGGRWIRTIGPRSRTAFFETPVRAFGARPSAREEIGPAEKEGPFRGGVTSIARAFDRHQAAGLALIGRSGAEAGGRPRAALLYKRAQKQADEVHTPIPPQRHLERSRAASTLRPNRPGDQQAATDELPDVQHCRKTAE